MGPDKYSIVLEGNVLSPSKRVGGAISAMLCNAVEFYDITLFAIFALSIGRSFFPNDNPSLELLAVLAVFGASFVARPLGSVMIGRYADKRGRRAALILTASIMAIATMTIAVMPSYDEVGAIAPVIIIIARLAQGFAFGGEVGPSTALVYELAPAHRRNLYASWQPAGQGLATMVAGLMGLALSASLQPADIDAWGWRIPFVLGAMVLWLTLIVRSRMPETLPGAAAGEAGAPRPPMISLFRNHPGILLAIVTQIAFGTVVVYVCTFLNVYLQTAFATPPALSFTSTSLSGLSIGAGALAGGFLADLFGYRRVIYSSRIVLLLVAYPLFAAAHGSIAGVILLSSLVPFLAMISGGASFGPIAGALPAAMRSTGLSISYAVVVCLIGGSIQFVMTMLISATGDPLVPAYCIMLFTVVGIVGLPLLAGGAEYRARAEDRPDAAVS